MDSLAPLASLSSSAPAWIGLIAAIVILLALDLKFMSGRGGEMDSKFAAKASVFWIGIAFAFAGVLWVTSSPADASVYIAGYLVEKSLSLDNVFVFLLLLNAFAIAAEDRHRLLTYGIAGALVLRAVFIFIGAAALSAFWWVNIIFAAVLIVTGWRLWQHRHDHGAEEELVESVRKRLPIAAEEHEGARWVARENGKRVLTVSGAALAGLIMVDVLFAIDSVPAILALTDDVYIVFAANAFALMGLRPLFFLVADLVDRLYYLKAALAILLIVIGAKIGVAHWVGKIGPEITLPAIALVLGTGVVASLVRNRRQAAAGGSST
ncbi:MAG: TerC/Alx family metal homeostasis membrane protein [Solirubrobacterales bacterium]